MSAALSSRDARVLASVLDESVDEQQQLKDGEQQQQHDVDADVKQKEKDAVQVAATDEEAALCLLSRLIEEHPRYGSVYNNRAQLLMQRSPDAALRDASTAISLGQTSSVLRAAYATQATLLYSLGRQEEASRAYALAGKHGWELGRAMSIRTNPYAKFCGEMVATMLTNEQEA